MLNQSVVLSSHVRSASSNASASSRDCSSMLNQSVVLSSHVRSASSNASASSRDCSSMLNQSVVLSSHVRSASSNASASSRDCSSMLNQSVVLSSHVRSASSNASASSRDCSSMLNQSVVLSSHVRSASSNASASSRDCSSMLNQSVVLSNHVRFASSSVAASSQRVGFHSEYVSELGEMFEDRLLQSSNGAQVILCLPRAISHCFTFGVDLASSRANTHATSPNSLVTTIGSVADGVFSLLFDIAANAGLPALPRPVIDFIKQFSRPIPPITTDLITVSISTRVDCVYSLLHVFYELGAHQLLVDRFVTTVDRELPASSRDCSSMLNQSVVLSNHVRFASSSVAASSQRVGFHSEYVSELGEMFEDRLLQSSNGAQVILCLPRAISHCFTFGVDLASSRANTHATSPNSLVTTIGSVADGVFSLLFDIANAGLPALPRPVIDFIKQFSRPIPPITTDLITVSISTRVDCVYSLLHVFYELGAHQLLVDRFVTTVDRELPASSRDWISMLNQSVVLSNHVRFASTSVAASSQRVGFHSEYVSELGEMFEDRLLQSSNGAQVIICLPRAISHCFTFGVDLASSRANTHATSPNSLVTIGSVADGVFSLLFDIAANAGLPALPRPVIDFIKQFSRPIPPITTDLITVSISTRVDCVYSLLHVFYELGAHQLLVDRFVTTVDRELPAYSRDWISMLNQSVVLSSHVRSASSNASASSASSSKDRKTPQSATAAQWEDKYYGTTSSAYSYGLAASAAPGGAYTWQMPPLQSAASQAANDRRPPDTCVPPIGVLCTSSSFMAEHLGAPPASTSSHRRARSPHWSYHLYPAKTCLDIIISRSYAIQLKELRLFGPPTPSLGQQKIRACLSKHDSPVQMVFTLPAEERRYGREASVPFDKERGSEQQTCNDVIQKTGCQIELCESRDHSLTIVVTGRRAAIEEARKLIVQQLQQQATREMRVPKEHHRVLIGKEGKRLADLERSSDCRIILPPRDAQNDVIRIIGPREGIEKAVHQIQILSDEQSKLAQEHLFIEPEYYPWIRGPNNENVESIMKRTGARINIPPPAANMKIIIITGEKEGVYAAAAELKTLYEDKQSKVQTVSIKVAKSQHRFVVGPQGQGIVDVLRATDVAVEVPPMDSDIDSITLRGEPDRLADALSMCLAKASSVITDNVECPTWLHKFIIGPHGSNIRKIVGDPPRLQVDFEDEGFIYIEGAPEVVREAKEYLLQQTKELSAEMGFAVLNIKPTLHRHIIGKGGSHIAKIKEETGVQVNVPDEKDHSDAVRIEGKKEMVVQAKKMIEEIVERIENERQRDMMIEQRFHRTLIGQNGKAVQHLRELFPGVQISFPEPGRKSNLVSLRGPKDELEKCYKHLEKVTKQLLENNYQVRVPIFKEFHGQIIGKGGANIRKIRDETDTKIDVPAENADTDEIVVTGKRQNAEKVRDMLTKLQDELASIVQSELQIPHRLHAALNYGSGRLIGSIQEECGGVHIRFPDSKSKSDKISIRGPSDGVEKAKELLSQLAKDKEASSFTAEIKAKPEHYRFLIGRQGMAIKKMKDMHPNVRILFPRPNDQDQETIHVIGKKDEVQAVEKELQATIEGLKQSIESTIDVESQYHRAFVIRGAALVREIQDSCGGVTIFFPRQHEDSTVVRIRGPKDCVEKAKKRIQETVEDMKCQVTTEVEIEQRHHRALLSNRGEKIHKICDEFKVQLKFPERQNSEKAENENEEGNEDAKKKNVDIVTLAGRPENCEKAKEALLALVPVTVTLSCPFDYHRLLIGRNGENLRKVQEDFEVNVTIPPRVEEKDEITVYGAPANTQLAVEELEKQIAKFDEQKKDNELRSFKVTVKVAAVYMPKLIGPRGKTISEVRDKFDVNISLPAANTQSDEVTIHGYEENATKAAAEIERMVAAFESMVTQEIILDCRIHSRLIGQKGRGIRKIMDDYRVDVRFPRSGDKDPNLVAITGQTEDDVWDCVDYLRNMEEEYMQVIAVVEINSPTTDSAVSPMRGLLPLEAPEDEEMLIPSQVCEDVSKLPPGAVLDVNKIATYFTEQKEAVSIPNLTDFATPPENVSVVPTSAEAIATTTASASSSYDANMLLCLERSKLCTKPEDLYRAAERLPRHYADDLFGERKTRERYNHQQQQQWNQNQQRKDHGPEWRNGKRPSADVTLRTAEKAWRPRKLKTMGDVMMGEEVEDAVTKTVRPLLNKITPSNMDAIAPEFSKIIIDHENHMLAVIDLLFEKAVEEPKFCGTYSRLCGHTTESQMGKSNDSSFRKMLLIKCESEFERENVEEGQRLQKANIMQRTEDPEEKKKLKEELDLVVSKQKRRLLGTLRFIGELYVHHLLTDDIMDRVIQLILKNDEDEDSIECLCKLLTTTGKMLDQVEANSAKVDQYMVHLDQIAHEKLKDTSKRHKFMILDLQDLRLNNWEARRKEKGPMTITEVHNDIENERRAKAEAAADLVRQTRQRGRGSKQDTRDSRQGDRSRVSSQRFGTYGTVRHRYDRRTDQSVSPQQ